MNCYQNCCQGSSRNMCNPCHCGPQPIVADKKVCTTCCNRYVEQPVICPIECRRVQNVVYVPRYYPRYENTFYTQNQQLF